MKNNSAESKQGSSSEELDEDEKYSEDKNSEDMQTRWRIRPKIGRVKLKNEDVGDFPYAGYTLQVAFLGALKL